MCGIWGFIEFSKTHDISKLFKSYMTVQKRGQDKSTFTTLEYDNKIHLGFHRLALMDKSTKGDQPFTFEVDNQRTIYAICNGEIYNFKNLVKENNFIMKGRSDCEFLPQMYAKYGFETMLNKINGEFGLCIIDIINENYIKVYISRDQTGVRPLFFGYDDNGFCFSSILTGICHNVEHKNVRQLKRGEFACVEIIKNEKPKITTQIYHSLENIKLNPEFTENRFETILNKIHDTFVRSVIKRLHSDRPMGALLSGGLDSSLVVAIASSYLQMNKQKLRTFSIGMNGSTDEYYAKLVSKHCNTEHTHIEFTEQEFLNAIKDVVFSTETHDITTVRASVGQYLISKWIKENTDIRVLLIGDGSDELCSGYMYFHKAPTPEESHKENIRLIEDIQYYDSLRADRCIASNNIEARVPFLDLDFVELYLSIPYNLRIPKQENERKVEKWLLRKAFDEMNYLPKEVLWRKKEAFSDGVSSKEKSWYMIIQEQLSNKYNKQDFENIEVSYHLKPVSNEALYYRKLFNEYFSYDLAHVIPYYWLPKWCGNITEPSARVLQVYKE